MSTESKQAQSPFQGTLPLRRHRRLDAVALANVFLHNKYNIPASLRRQLKHWTAEDLEDLLNLIECRVDEVDNPSMASVYLDEDGEFYEDFADTVSLVPKHAKHNAAYRRRFIPTWTAMLDQAEEWTLQEQATALRAFTDAASPEYAQRCAAFEASGGGARGQAVSHKLNLTDFKAAVLAAPDHHALLCRFVACSYQPLAMLHEALRHPEYRRRVNEALVVAALEGGRLRDQSHGSLVQLQALPVRTPAVAAAHRAWMEALPLRAWKHHPSPPPYLRDALAAAAAAAKATERASEKAAEQAETAENIERELAVRAEAFMQRVRKGEEEALDTLCWCSSPEELEERCRCPPDDVIKVLLQECTAAVGMDILACAWCEWPVVQALLAQRRFTMFSYCSVSAARAAARLSLEQWTELVLHTRPPADPHEGWRAVPWRDHWGATALTAIGQHVKQVVLQQRPDLAIAMPLEAYSPQEVIALVTDGSPCVQQHPRRWESGMYRPRPDHLASKPLLVAIAQHAPWLMRCYGDYGDEDPDGVPTALDDAQVAATLPHAAKVHYLYLLPKELHTAELVHAFAACEPMNPSVKLGPACFTDEALAVPGVWRHIVRHSSQPYQQPVPDPQALLLMRTDDALALTMLERYGPAAWPSLPLHLRTVANALVAMRAHQRLLRSRLGQVRDLRYYHNGVVCLEPEWRPLLADVPLPLRQHEHVAPLAADILALCGSEFAYFPASLQTRDNALAAMRASLDVPQLLDVVPEALWTPRLIMLALRRERGAGVLEHMLHRMRAQTKATQGLRSQVRDSVFPCSLG